MADNYGDLDLAEANGSVLSDDGKEVDEGDPGYHSMGRNIKRLEDQHLNGDRHSGRSPGTVPGKIRDIVTSSISTGDPKMASTSPLGDENRMLNSEVSRLEDLLAATRAERDEIGSKYMAVSERLENYMKGSPGRTNAASGMGGGIGGVSNGTPDRTGNSGISPSKGDASGYGGMSALLGESGSPGDSGLAQQVAYLKTKLEEEHANYKRKLQAYQDGQQRQAQLVQKLQQKVLQYKKKCGELETSVNETKQSEEDAKKKLMSANDSLREQEAKLKETEEEQSSELENALIRLEEEQHKNASLQHVNNMIRDQLEDANAANEQLTMDIQKLKTECDKAREELDARDEEEQAYFSNEHNRLMDLWKSLNGFRKQFSEMKSATQRDLSGVRAEVNKSVRVVQGACMDLDKNLRGMDSNTQAALEEERKSKEKAEEQLRGKVQEFIELQNKFDNEKTDLMVKVKDLTNLKEKLEAQIKEQDKTIETQRKKLSSLVSTGTKHTSPTQSVYKVMPLGISTPKTPTSTPLAIPPWFDHLASEVGQTGGTRSFLYHVTTAEIDPNRSFVLDKDESESQSPQKT